MKGKLIIVVGLTVFVAACTQRGISYATASVPPLPRSIAKKITDCNFSFGNRTGMSMSCRNKVHLTMAEAVVVEKWARAKDREIRYSQHPPVNFSLFEVRSYPGYVTTSKWQQKHYGYPKYMRRGWSTTHRSWYFGN